MDLKQAAFEYEKATSEFLTLANSIEEVALDLTDGDGWSPRQVVHHVADSEAQSYARLRRLIAEPGTQIQGYEEAIWGENQTLGYTELPIDISLAVIKSVRASSLEIIKRLSIDQLENSGVHTESGPYSIKTWLQTYTQHPLDHANQIRAQLQKD
jgi:hypothetical protein